MIGFFVNQDIPETGKSGGFRKFEGQFFVPRDISSKFIQGSSGNSVPYCLGQETNNR